MVTWLTRLNGDLSWTIIAEFNPMCRVNHEEIFKKQFYEMVRDVVQFVKTCTAMFPRDVPDFRKLTIVAFANAVDQRQSRESVAVG